LVCFALLCFAVGFNRWIKRIEKVALATLHTIRNGAKAAYRSDFYPSAKADGKVQLKQTAKLRQTALS